MCVCVCTLSEAPLARGSSALPSPVTQPQSLEIKPHISTKCFSQFLKKTSRYYDYANDVRPKYVLYMPQLVKCYVEESLF